MKKFQTFILTFILILCSILPVQASTLSDMISVSPTPKISAHMKYKIKLGNGYRSSPTPPVLYKNYIITVSAGTLYKINAADGSIESCAKLTGQNFYSVVSPLIEDDKIFVQLDNGIIQALDFETLSSLWIYRDSLAGQALCPIVYDNGFIYTGFWNGEADNASFVCIDTASYIPSDTSKEKTAVWTYVSKGGFYYTQAAIKGEYVIFGSDNGVEDASAKGKITALNKTDGKLASFLDVTGDIRNGIFYDKDTECFYTASKGGYLYKFFLNEKNGQLKMISEKKLSGEVTSTPAVYNKRLYTFCSKEGAGEFAVFDAETMEIIYTCDMKGYCQGNILISNFYEDIDGYIYIYASYNTLPGGITLFKDKKGQVAPIKTELFAPSEEYSQYCISPVISDKNGTLYYKNDSGCIFAVEETYETLPLFSALADFFAVISSIIRKISIFCKTGAFI